MAQQDPLRALALQSQHYLARLYTRPSARTVGHGSKFKVQRAAHVCRKIWKGRRRTMRTRLFASGGSSVTA